MLQRHEVAAELGLLDGAERVDDGGFGDERTSADGSSWRRAAGGFWRARRRYRTPRPGRAPVRTCRLARRIRRAPTCGSHETARPDAHRSHEIRTRRARCTRFASLTPARRRRPILGRTLITGVSEVADQREHRVGRSPRPGRRPAARSWSREAHVPEVDVRLVEVVKKFGDAVAVDHIDLEVQDGEFFSLLGPSGCGKTTTLRMIGGFEQPTPGLIELQGEDVTWLPPYKRNVNTVFQNYALFPHLTIFENVAFGLRRKGVKDARSRRASPRCSSSSSCPATSGASRTRSRAARRSASRSRARSSTSPAVLLLDEPLGALDLKLRKQMQVELKRIQQEVGITFIYVTHDQEEAMTMSDRIAVMNHGPLRAAGRPRERCTSGPTTRFVAGFLGRQQPAARRRVDGRGDGYAERRARGRRSRSGSRGARRRRDARSTSASGRRRSGCTSRRTPSADRPQPAARASSRDASYLGVSTQYIVETRGGAPTHGLRAERRARDHGRSCGRRGRRGPADLVARPHASSSRAERCGPSAAASEETNLNQERHVRRHAGQPAGTILQGRRPSPGVARVPRRAAPGPRPASVGARRRGRRRAVRERRPPRRRRRRHRRRHRRPPKAVTGPLKFANWPAYIDLPGAAAKPRSTTPGSSPTLEEFKKKYGVEVDYQEKIGDNDAFVETIKPALVGGLRDRLGPHGPDRLDGREDRRPTAGPRRSTTTNVPNCRAQPRATPLKNQPWDPTNDYHYPWQSGMTGVGFNAKTLKDEQHRRADEDRRPLDHPGRQGDVPDGGARHVRARAAQARHRRRSGATVTADDLQKVVRRHPAAGRQGAPLHRQRVPAGLRPEEGLGGVSSGPATSRRPAARTTSSSSPRRGR